MAKLVFEPEFNSQMAAMDAGIQELNHRKIRLLFDTLGLTFTETELKGVLHWDLILITVRDRTMCRQLNALCAYVPNLKFVFDDEKLLFTVLQGVKSRRVWKER